MCADVYMNCIKNLLWRGKWIIGGKGDKNSQCTALKSNVSQDSVRMLCVNYMISAAIRSAHAHPVAQERSMNNHPRSTNQELLLLLPSFLPPSVNVQCILYVTILSTKMHK